MIALLQVLHEFIQDLLPVAVAVQLRIRGRVISRASLKDALLAL